MHEGSGCWQRGRFLYPKINKRLQNFTSPYHTNVPRMTKLKKRARDRKWLSETECAQKPPKRKGPKKVESNLPQEPSGFPNGELKRNVWKKVARADAIST